MAMPNWSYWMDPDLRFWTPEQAIALWLNVEPRQAIPEHQREAYADKLRLLKGAIESHNAIVPVRNGKLDRYDFVLWASSDKGWPGCPPELQDVDPAYPRHLRAPANTERAPGGAEIRSDNYIVDDTPCHAGGITTESPAVVQNGGYVVVSGGSTSAIDPRLPTNAPLGEPQSQRITVEDLAWQIAVQRADQGTSHSHGPDQRDGLRRTIEIALQVRGWSPDGIPGVIPQIAEMAQARLIALHGPAGAEAPDAHEISSAPAAWSLTADDAQTVLASMCHVVRRYTIADAADVLAKMAHPNDYIAEHALRSSLISRMDDAMQKDELVPNERRKDGEMVLNEYSIDEWLAREQIPFRLNPRTQASAEQAAMRSAGRLLIEDVVGILAKETGTDAARWESTLIAEIKAGALPLKNPRDIGDFLPYAVPKNLRTFYDRLDVADVNALLDSRGAWRVGYRFPVEATPASQTLHEGRSNSAGTASATKHAIGTRSNALKAVIDKAKSLAENPSDTHSVWAALSKLAQEERRPAPLVGYVEAEGVKWDDNGTVKILTKKNFADRVWRAKTR